MSKEDVNGLLLHYSINFVSSKIGRRGPESRKFSIIDQVLTGRENERISLSTFTEAFEASQSVVTDAITVLNKEFKKNNQPFRIWRITESSLDEKEVYFKVRNYKK